MSIKKGSLYIAGGGSGSGRNIGDIFYTTRTDTSLSGAVECNGGTYSTADYAGAGSIGELLASGKLPYVSLTDYATQITNNGVCGVFGWDGTGTTAFRVPTLKDMFIECGQANELGDYIGAGLPNAKGVFDGLLYVAPYNTSAVPMTGTGVFSDSGAQSEPGRMHIQRNQGTNQIAKLLDFNMNNGSSVYKDEITTVQPEAIKYRAMIQLFNGTTDEAVATVGMVVAQVGENTTQIANRVIKGHEVIDFQIPTEENGYTWYRLYADGWVEQGGSIENSVGGSSSVVLPIEMKDTRYTVLAQQWNTGSQVGLVQSKTTTSFVFGGGSVGKDGWFVSGKSKQN